MTEITNLKVTEVKPDPNQPRKTFDAESLSELAQSIKANGVIQPIEVSLNGNGYTIHHGERRWRASMIAGKETVPAIIVEPMPEDARFVRAVIENEQREDMGPMDKARAYRRLMDEFGYSRQRIVREIGRSWPYVDNLLRWLELEPEIQEMVNGKKLPIDRRVAEALLTVPVEARPQMVKRLTRNGKPSMTTVITACANFNVALKANKPRPIREVKRPQFPPALTMLKRQPIDQTNITWLQVKAVAQEQCGTCDAWQPGDDTLICGHCPLAKAVRMLSEWVC